MSAGPLPVVVLSGFLGSGKTTFVKRLLSQAKAEAPELRIGVVLNEVGIAGIDSISATAFSELSDACACCVRSDDFVATLNQLQARGDLDWVLLETTGIADPLALAWRIETRSLLPNLALECVLTAVDPTTPEAFVRDEWNAQVLAADWVMLTKQDLASGPQNEAAEQAVRRVRADAQRMSEDAVRAALIVRPPSLREPPAGFRFVTPTHSRLSGLIISSHREFKLAELEAWLEALPDEIVRVKAIVNSDEGWASLHRVGRRLNTEFDVAAPAHGESRFAFFADDVETRFRSLVEPVVGKI
jgi:G3E family GTPase